MLTLVLFSFERNECHTVMNVSYVVGSYPNVVGYSASNK